MSFVLISLQGLQQPCRAAGGVQAQAGRTVELVAPPVPVRRPMGCGASRSGRLDDSPSVDKPKTELVPPMPADFAAEIAKTLSTAKDRGAYTEDDENDESHRTPPSHFCLFDDANFDHFA